MADRLRLGVLFGGPSAEHEVSCSSALAVIRALDPERFEAFAIGITRERDFVLISEDVLEKLRVSTRGCSPSLTISRRSARPWR